MQERSSDLRGWTADYLSADADGRARMWEDATGLGELVLDQAALACYDVVPETLGRVMPYLESERSRRRACAAGAVGALARHPSVAEQRPMLVGRLVSMTDAAEDPYELATIVIAVGQLYGDTRPWLGDPNPGLRGCAALAPALADDETTTGVLLELAASPRAFGASFGDMAPPQHFQMPTHGDLLMQALLERVGDPGADW